MGQRDNPACKRVTSIFGYKLIKGETPKIFGDGDQTRDFIYVLDIANFIVENMNKNPKHRLFNLANGEQISVNEIFKILKEISTSNISAEHIEAVYWRSKRHLS